jgi:hypothetical protein
MLLSHESPLFMLCRDPYYNRVAHIIITATKREH